MALCLARSMRFGVVLVLVAMPSAHQATRAAVVSPPEEASALIDGASQELLTLRKHPLLVLYYPFRARITQVDMGDVYSSFRSADLVVEQKLDSLDVLIESNGGDPVAAYRLAQIIRDFAKDVTFLVPDHAYSAATLLCFAAKEIRLGHYAGLSPIDITLVSEPAKRPREEVELASIDSFMDFASKAREKIEQTLQDIGCKGSTQVDSDLLVKMVDEIGALEVGRYFRSRTLTGHYAQELLDRYMFAGQLDFVDRRNQVIDRFLFGAPIHDFDMDYHLCKKWRLFVEQMPTAEFDLAKQVVDTLDTLAYSGVICPNLSRKERIPFIRFYPLPTEVAVEESHETQQSS